MEERIGGAKRRALQRSAPNPRGFAVKKQRRFLEHLAATCNVTASANAAGISLGPPYKLRQRDAGFAAAWKEAMQHGYDRLEEALIAKALGEVEPVAFDPDAVEVVLVDDPPAEPGRKGGVRRAAGLSDKVALVEVQLALALLNRRQAMDRGSRERSPRRATAEEVEAAINAKLDSLAARLKEQRCPTPTSAPSSRWRGWRRRLRPRGSRCCAHCPRGSAPSSTIFWRAWAHDGQREPAGDWRVWMIRAGRGFGKTRADAEWVSGVARTRPDARIALVGATAAEARAVMVEGPSGLIAVARDDEPVRWRSTTGELVFASGAVARIYSAATPEALRGPEHHVAWCDELAKWPRGAMAWDNLMMGLRLGERPRVLVTTTPRPNALMRRLLAMPGLVETRGSTRDNPHLPGAFVAAMDELYGGTRLGRQELDGEMIDDVTGALWTRAGIEACRVAAPPPLRRVVVGVDPPAGTTRGGGGGDACGIVAAGLGSDGCG